MRKKWSKLPKMSPKPAQNRPRTSKVGFLAKSRVLDGPGGILPQYPSNTPRLAQNWAQNRPRDLIFLSYPNLPHLLRGLVWNPTWAIGDGPQAWRPLYNHCMNRTGVSDWLYFEREWVLIVRVRRPRTSHLARCQYYPKDLRWKVVLRFPDVTSKKECAYLY